MNQNFQIGDFCFRIAADDTIPVPGNFMKFTADPASIPVYTYHMHVEEELPAPTGRLIVKRPDLYVYQTDSGEKRYLSDFTPDSFWGSFCEVSESQADVTILKKELPMLHYDTYFCSLLMLEKQMILRDSLILHSAYIVYQDEAILFSAPSQTGKSTQAALWEKYRKSYTVNGDRSLLRKINGRWYACSWPVCGSSGICNIKDTPIHAIVMLRQGKKNIASPLPAIHAFTELYAQITSNKWNRAFVQRAMDDLENLISSVPVWQLTCDISENAVKCLEKALY